jgi:signal transduction histidine kinase/ActR/RegA family two-component response regulator
VGAMWLSFKTPRVFSEDDRSLLRTLAQQCAQAIERARLFESEQASRAAAESASRLKDEFLATVSHELRTPLTAILGWARMLSYPTLDTASREKAIETIQRNAKAQDRLIEDILDVSRIITGKLRLDVQATDLQPVIQAAVEVLLPAAEAKGIRLHQVLDPNSGTVLGDAERLQQVAWNLVSNAIKFTPKGGRVMIVLQRINSHTEFTVSDTGKGISPDFLPYVFDRFRQAESSTIRAHEGLGLGLAIVRHLVELHGGTVHADSRGDGQGATFTVRLPLVPVSYSPSTEALEEERVHPTAEPGTGVPSPPLLLRDVHVLVAEDDADARELLSAVLGKAGAKVTTTACSAEALRVFQESSPDVLLADIGMPGEDGYALIRKVRSREAELGQDRIPAIALTAYARVQDRLQALEAGYQVHLSKPIEPTELVLTIAGLLRRTSVVAAEETPVPKP